MGQWEYEQLLEQGVRPLAEKAPYRVARILIDTTARMVDLKTHDDERGERGEGERSFLRFGARGLTVVGMATRALIKPLSGLCGLRVRRCLRGRRIRLQT